MLECMEADDVVHGSPIIGAAGLAALGQEGLRQVVHGAHCCVESLQGFLTALSPAGNIFPLCHHLCKEVLPAHIQRLTSLTQNFPERLPLKSHSFVCPILTCSCSELQYEQVPAITSSSK
jgi:hypothetical protein